MIDITLLRDRSRLKKISRGTIISGSGSGIVMFAVLRGEVCVITGYATPNMERLSMLGAGDFYIDSALLDEDSAAYTTVAVSDAVILPIEKTALYSFMRDEPEIAGEVVRELTNRRDAAALANGGDESKAAPAVNNAVQTEGGFKLFPDGHGECRLPVGNRDNACLMSKMTVCPICGKPFSVPVVRASKLVVEHTDSDMRTRYKGVEPLYYEVLTCPSCLYSAMRDVFDKPERRRPDIQRELSGIVGGLETGYQSLPDSDAVFARYYLALRCAPICFVRHHYLTAKLLYILSRLYQDAGNDTLEIEMAAQALAAFTDAYQNERLTPTQEQQVCVLLGELYLKQNDLKNSAIYFNKAKTSGEKTSVLHRHAEDRIYDIRTMAAAR